MIKSIIIALASMTIYLMNPGDRTLEKQQINQVLDEWHAAAARADSKAYFGAIAEDGVFIGTDAKEVWTKQEFFEWSKPYFDAGKAWDFKGKERNIYFSGDGSIAWFDELAHSSSGDWRGSGVLERTGNTWKIKQYVLSVTIPNDILEEVVKIVKEYESN